MDPTLLTIFIMVAITAITTWALMYYLGRRDERKLFHRHLALAKLAASSQIRRTETAVPLEDRDIRQFVAGRAQQWLVRFQTSSPKTD